MKTRLLILMIVIIIILSVLSYLEWGTGTPSQLHCIFNRCSVELGSRTVYPVFDSNTSRTSVGVSSTEFEIGISDSEQINQECARLFDKIFDTWEKHVDENYGGPGQPILEPPAVWGLIAGWEGGEEFRDSDCRYTVNDWAFLAAHQEQVWGNVDWPKLEPFPKEIEFKPELICLENQVILYDNCTYVLSSEDDPPKHDRYFLKVNDTITQICRESWGETNAEKCHDISSYTISDNHVIELEAENEN